jgi:hypothetical protein
MSDGGICHIEGDQRHQELAHGCGLLIPDSVSLFCTSRYVVVVWISAIGTLRTFQIAPECPLLGVKRTSRTIGRQNVR